MKVGQTVMRLDLAKHVLDKLSRFALASHLRPMKYDWTNSTKFAAEIFSSNERSILNRHRVNALY